jgi:hypothetical protein
MNMQNEDRDWLDERIAATNYIPDDGFTAKVVGRLPKTRSNAAELFRWRILFVTTFLALCLFAVQMVSVAQGVNQWITRDSLVKTVGQVAAFVQQPGVIYSAAGCVMLLGFASIPFLRRWA